jgi:hypothetical protein
LLQQNASTNKGCNTEKSLELNKMLARSPEELSMYQQMDKRFEADLRVFCKAKGLRKAEYVQSVCLAIAHATQMLIGRWWRLV